MFSQATFSFDLDVVNTYKTNVAITLNFFDVTPLKLLFKWVRAEAAVMNGFNYWDAQIAALYSVTLLKGSATFTENIRTLQYSLLDTMVDPFTNALFPSTYGAINTDA